ncbi:MAG: VTC domain-containing protein [Patescibacteria group bacterium]
MDSIKNKLHIMNQDLIPIMYSNYSRITFISPFANLRVTFDFNIQFVDQKKDNKVSLKFILMEVK